MPRGIPKSGKRKTKNFVDTENVVPEPWEEETATDTIKPVEKTLAEKPKVAEKVIVAEGRYSCGCAVVAVNETRNKEKCIVHQVA